MIDALIIDDDYVIAQLLQEVLALDDYTSAVIPHGRAALDWLAMQLTPPRALIVDLAMPQMDGPTLIARVMKMPRMHDVSIIVMSAERRPDILLRGLPIAGILTKPFHIESLLELMNRAVMPTALAA